MGRKGWRKANRDERVREEAAKVEVDRRRETALEREGAELDGPERVHLDCEAAQVRLVQGTGLRLCHR